MANILKSLEISRLFYGHILGWILTYFVPFLTHFVLSFTSSFYFWPLLPFQFSIFRSILLSQLNFESLLSTKTQSDFNANVVWHFKKRPTKVIIALVVDFSYLENRLLWRAFNDSNIVMEHYYYSWVVVVTQRMSEVTPEVTKQ